MRLPLVVRPVVAVVALSAVLPTGVSAESVTALLQRQSQAFSDASAAGDKAALSRLLDDRVTFINENGEIGSKSDVVASAGPPPAGVQQTLRQRDFHVVVHGSVAVTSFTDESTLRFHGQLVHASFLSTEVWLSESGGWKMISSQTLALQNDPPAIVLAPQALVAYVGTYSAGPGYVVRIAVRGPSLVATVNGANPVTLRAEARDVFFVAGQPRVRRIFQRSASGAIVGYVSRREGRDIVFRRTG
jgi:hypothetical protein